LYRRFGGNRNPEESGGIRRNLEESGVNTGIPVTQEFLQKNPVTGENNRNSCGLSKTMFLCKIPLENTGKKEILRNPVRNVFLSKKYIPENRNYEPRCHDRLVSSSSPFTTLQHGTSAVGVMQD